MTYCTLFLLEADTAFIFEIKRLDLQSKKPADVYFWLYFDKASQVLHQLTFVSMSASGDEQQRKFTQGSLRFNATGGTYAPHIGSQALTLRTVAPAVLPAQADAALHAFFRQ